MIIGSNFVYLHVPKTGGTSFCRMMKDRHRYEETLSPIRDEHNTARDIPHNIRDTHFIFGLMRDPIKAEASNYYYHTTSWKENCSPDFSFEHWCEWRFGGKPREWASPWISDPSPLEYGHIFSVRPSAGYFCDENGECIASHIYRFEDMAKSMEEIGRTIGLDCNLEDYHVLKSKSKAKPKPVVTDRCVELIRKAKPMDFIIYYTQGDIPTNYRCKTVDKYSYTRPEDD